jgi:uncharacterized protein YcbX
MSAGARVAALYRYPVKSMQGAALERAALTPRGIPGDRAWALRARANGKTASAKRFAALLLCRARFLDEPLSGRPAPPAEVELPDGTRTRTDAPGADALLSRLLGAEMAFVREDDGAGQFDDEPLHLLTTAALKTMAAATGLDFDPRRFRPNILVALDVPGRPEDAWPGRELFAGAARLRVRKPVARCVMTTLPQPGLAGEPGVYRSVYERGGALGVYAAALAAADCAAGDPVEIAERNS